MSLQFFGPYEVKSNEKGSYFWVSGQGGHLVSEGKTRSEAIRKAVRAIVNTRLGRPLWMY